MAWLTRPKACKMAGIKLKYFSKMCALLDSVWDENPTAYPDYLVCEYSTYYLWDHALDWFLKHHPEMIKKLKDDLYSTDDPFRN